MKEEKNYKANIWCPVCISRGDMECFEYGDDFEYFDTLEEAVNWAEEQIKNQFWKYYISSKIEPGFIGEWKIIKE